MHRNPFRPSPNEPQFGDPKKVGICGAPQCKCTPLLLALCVALTGLILIGVGSCIIGFMGNHDDSPKALGASLIIIGFIMIFAGAACFIYDNFVRHRLGLGQTVGFAYQPHESTQFDQPSTSYGSSNPSPSVDIQKKSENVAPPPYEPFPQQKPVVHGSVTRGQQSKQLRV